MSMDTSQLPIPKPEPRARTKARKGRHEDAVIRRVREQCVERDGHCKLGEVPWHACGWPSDWAHAHSHRRSKTMGLPPEERHTVKGSMMLCRPAHDAYDRHELNIDALSDDGCDGDVVVSWHSRSAVVSCNGVQVRERR